MRVSETLRQESLDSCSDELRGFVAESVLDLGINEYDRALGVDDDGRVGRQIEKRPGQLARESILLPWMDLSEADPISHVMLLRRDQ